MTVLFFSVTSLHYNVCFPMVYIAGVQNTLYYTKGDGDTGVVGSPDALKKRCESMNLNRTIYDVSDIPYRSLHNLGYSDAIRAMVCDQKWSSANDWLKVITGNLIDEQCHLNFGKLTPRYQALVKSLIQSVGVRLEQYFKFIITRHPFERLVYIYKNLDLAKVFRNPTKVDDVEAWSTYVKLVIHEVRNKTGKSNFPFNPFIKFVLHTEPHFYPWHTVYDTCLPCVIEYEFVAQYEWDERRKNVLASKLDITDEAALHKLYKIDVVPEWWTYYQDIDPTDIKKLYQMYRLDFELFGYKWPNL